MEIVREICIAQTEDLKVKLPREFVKRKLEVIILPFYQEKQEKPDRKERLMKIYNASKGTLPGDYKFNRDEAHER
jgi:hypothetical protein